MDDSSEPAATAPAPAAAEAAEDIFFSADELSRGTTAADSNYFLFPTLTPSRAGDRRLVYNVTMRLQTTDFLPGMRTLLDTVGEMEGYLISAYVRGYDLRNPTVNRSADFRFRVPTERLAEFIVVVENNYNIWSLQQEMQEVTERYQRTAWGLNDLREEEQYLLELLEEAEGYERTAALDNLAQVRSSIRELEAAQASIMDSVIYSTIDVQLFEAAPNYVSSQFGFSPAFLFTAALLALATIIVIIILVIQRQKNTSTNTK